MDRNKPTLGNAILAVAEIAVVGIMCKVCFKSMKDEIKADRAKKKQEKTLKKSVEEALKESEETIEENI